MELLGKMVANGIGSVECRQDVHDDYNERLDEALSHTIWAHPGMTTYYRNSRGRVVTTMPWTNSEYWQMTRQPDLDEFHVVRASAVDGPDRGRVAAGHLVLVDLEIRNRKRLCPLSEHEVAIGLERSGAGGALARTSPARAAPRAG